MKIASFCLLVSSVSCASSFFLFFFLFLRTCCVCCFVLFIYSHSPIRFNEKCAPSARMLTSTHSPGGRIIATGCTDHKIRIYRIDDVNGPEKILDVDAHSVCCTHTHTHNVY